MLSELILDIIIEIAKYDEEVWFKFYLYNEQFKDYACSQIGIDTFKNEFTKIIVCKMCTEYKLFNQQYIIYNNGDRKWYQHGELHRDDGPAHIHSDGQIWYQHGKIHRDNGPAIIYPNGDEIWYQHGELHRDDGPAVIKNGSLKWYQHGQLHRDDGPAHIHSNGRFWYQHGKIHRDNGPAIIIYLNGQQIWYQHRKIHCECTGDYLS